MARAIQKKKPKNDTAHKEPLAIGYNSRSTFLLYRQVGSKGHELRVTSGTKTSKFTGISCKVSLLDIKHKQEDISKCSDFRCTSHGRTYTLTYIRHSESGPVLVCATSTDTKKWQISDVVSHVRTAGIPRLSDKDKISHIYFGDHIVRIATQQKRKWITVEPPRVPHWHFFEGVPFSLVGGLELGDSFMVVYGALHTVDIMKDVNLSDQKIGEERLLKIGIALFDKKIPTRLLWQTELPIVEIPIDTYGKVSLLGVVPSIQKKDATLYRVYIASEKGEMGYIEIPDEVIHHHRHVKPVQLKKFQDNPILTPTHLDWEVDGAFNPAALRLDGRVHLLYRASGNDGFSKIGYASSSDGLHIDERLKKPVYTPRYWFEYTEEPDGHISDSLFASGGGWGGCEDPKVTQIGDRIYMTYVAHTGQWPTRTVLTSISVDDFLKKKWRWSKPMLMSPPGVGSKSVVLMPEQINGKYVVFHRHWPNVMIDEVDSLEFGEGKQWLEGQHMIRPRKSYWDSKKMSIGATPIKTKDGWLTIYNAVDRMDGGKYKIGAMLLDLHDPKKVISRCRQPILSPEEFYEMDGKPGVAYPGGAVDIDGMLHVYYGGGDKVCAVAQIPVDELVWHLKKDSQPRTHIVRVGHL